MLDIKKLKGADGFYPDNIADLVVDANPEKYAILKRIGTATFSNSRYLAAWNWMEGLLNESGTSEEGSCGLLYGISGVGKSTVLRKFRKKYGGPFETASGRVRPVVRVSTPSDPNLGNLLDECLMALDASELAIGSNSDKKSAFARQLKLQQVKLLIFDEFSHIIEDKTEKFAKKAVRELKEILSEGRCQIIFAGTPEIQTLHSLYSQFRRRSAGDHCMAPFDAEDTFDQDEWRLLMGQMEERMAYKSEVPLDDVAMADKLHRATNGILDFVVKLLIRTSAIAYDRGEKVIPMVTFADAFEVMRRGDKSPNPFGLPSVRTAKPELVDDEPDDDEQSGLWSNGPKPRPDFRK